MTWLQRRLVALPWDPFTPAASEDISSTLATGLRLKCKEESYHRREDGKAPAVFMVHYQPAGACCQIMTRCSHSWSDLILPKPCQLTSSQNIGNQTTFSSKPRLKYSGCKDHSVFVIKFLQRVWAALLEDGNEKVEAVSQIPSHTVHFPLRLAPLQDCWWHRESWSSSKLNFSSAMMPVSTRDLVWHR